jgi:hypothetical protein
MAGALKEKYARASRQTTSFTPSKIFGITMIDPDEGARVAAWCIIFQDEYRLGEERGRGVRKEKRCQEPLSCFF